jgi:hypothetical protein
MPTGFHMCREQEEAHRVLGGGCILKYVSVKVVYKETSGSLVVQQPGLGLSREGYFHHVERPAAPVGASRGL